jgi:hypothetical protein
MVVLIIVLAVVFTLLLSNMDDRLLYIETYLRQINELLHEIKQKL